MRAVRHVLQYGAEAEVVSPDRLRRAIAERSRRVRRVSRLGEVDY
jgi:predicted DNA-binding transcriptional regulator YafY